MIIQKGKIYMASVLFLGMLSCNSDNGIGTDMASNSSSSSSRAVGATPLPPVNPQSTKNSSGIVNYPAIRTGQFLSASSTGVNPAHGMPGHDCAVAVGAPLPGAITAPVNNSVSEPLPIASSTQNLKPANLKVNPAHGQPGHDCKIAVGAPLDGSVSTAASSPLPARSNSVFTIPKITSSENLNPAHGKPGHDCSVAVGAPLPAK